MIHFTIDLALLLIGAIIGFLTGAQKSKSYLKLLPFFMLFILCVEFAGQLTQKPGMNNAPLYNIFTTIEFAFYLYFFREAINGEGIKKKITWLIGIFPLLCLVNIIFIQGLYTFQTYTYSIGSLLLVFLGTVYFYRLFKSNEYIKLLQEPAFWISIGIIFFFICSVSMLSISNYTRELPVQVRINIKKILKLVNAFFYLFFIIAFLCRSNTIRKYLSRS